MTLFTRAFIVPSVILSELSMTRVSGVSLPGIISIAWYLFDQRTLLCHFMNFGRGGGRRLYINGHTLLTVKTIYIDWSAVDLLLYFYEEIMSSE